MPGTLASLEQILAAPPAGRIVDVIARMRALDAVLPPGDGIGYFTKLYLAVTEAVNEAVRPGSFEDPRFVRWLDVVFANLYLSALRELTLGSGRPPRAWAPLVEARARPGIAPIQFALAGMNAHINRDLPVALVVTCRALHVAPQRGSPQHRDYLRVNGLLAETEARVKAWFARGIVRDVDRTLGRLDDAVALWNVRRARDAAWVHAETLWVLQHLPHVHSEFLGTLDRLVGFASRGLLRPLW